ncbi:Asp/Glu racemase [Amycolatopsis acidicola]|uniref:Asp/Glu racemase n=1 Tax=Amycolatopsis acidicola TaxID=2596893 RepID=A0A5N0UKY0_9PSEU|nr:aspartate/glutamate racemase family protein [Amycolatopsis acidicola]KAA9148897.1 Asp/Glu racemase [Amycolatopsis acidicola]
MERVPGPESQTGVGVVASFDFTRDRELWRWVPPDVTVYLTRTDPISSRNPQELVTELNAARYLAGPTKQLAAVGAQAVIYACTACSFIGGTEGEKALRDEMLACGASIALTTAGAVTQALAVVAARRVAVVHPYSEPVGERLRAYLTETGFDVMALRGLDLSAPELPDVTYDRVADLVLSGDHPAADAVFISCTALPTYDLIASLEQHLGKPVISANQATVWALLRAIARPALGPHQHLTQQGGFATDQQ